MKYYRFPDNRLTRIGFATFLFAMLLLSRDTLITSSIIGFYKATFIMYGLIGFVGLGFLWYNRKNFKQILQNERMLLALIATFVFVIPMLVKRDWQLLYLSVLICIYFAIFLSYFVSLEEVVKVYVVLMSFLGIWSWFATYVWKALVEAGVFAIPTFTNGEHNFYNFGLGFSIIWPYPYYRNFGIFREPGVYQFFIILALVLNNYAVIWDKTYKQWIYNIILIATMLTSFTTGGLLEVCVFVAVLFFDKKWYKDKCIIRTFLFVVILFVVIIIYSFIKDNNLYGYLKYTVSKLFNLKPSSSGGVRIQSILFDIRVFLEKPLFGEKLATVMYPDTVQYNTTSTMILFAGYGIFAGCFHVLSWVALLWDKNRKVWVNLALLLIMFMSFNTQDLTADMFLWLFPIMAMAEKGISFVKTLRLKGKV